MCNLEPPAPANTNPHGRRRSVDVGGLSLAMQGEGLGHGWGGWEERETGEVSYAELLSDMYTHTQNAVLNHDLDFPPLVIPEDTRHRLIRSLDAWNFEPHKLSDEEILACTSILFEALFRIEGMRNDIGVSLDQLSAFLSHLRRVYRWQNSYHNFQHALDVHQATHMFLSASGIIPPVSILLSDDRSWRPDKSSCDPHMACLSNEDLFALYVAAIGHDVGHPGFSNVFMKNAKTPLSQVYDDKSALEQMHCALLLPIMRHHGLGHLLDRPCSGPFFRELLLGTVLATDMSVHASFMQRFKAFAEGGSELSAPEQKILICQALIKCADISNPSRPHSVSKHWATALMAEWTNQAMLEKELHLPATVQPSDDPLAEAKSQVFFISTFALPLFALVSAAFPDMAGFAKACRENLDRWSAQSAALAAPAGVPAVVLPDSPSGSPPIRAARATSPTPSTLSVTDEYLSAFPLTLPTVLLTGAGAFDELRSRSPSPEREPQEEERGMPGAWPPSPSSDGTSSALPTPRSDTFSSHTRTTSVASSSGASESAAAIRKAYKASVRTKRSFHRASWNPPPREDAGAGERADGAEARKAGANGARMERYGRASAPQVHDPQFWAPPPPPLSVPLNGHAMVPPLAARVGSA